MAGSGLSVAGRSFLHMSPVLMDLGSYVWPDLTPAASLSSKYSHENLTIHSRGQYWAGRRAMGAQLTPLPGWTSRCFPSLAGTCLVPSVILVLP